MSSRKKGWKTVREMVGERPRPVAPDKQNALAFHSVMESGTFTASSLPPDTLVWRRKDRKNQKQNQPECGDSEIKCSKHGTGSRYLMFLFGVLWKSSSFSRSVSPPILNFFSPPFLFSFVPFLFSWWKRQLPVFCYFCKPGAI